MHPAIRKAWIVVAGIVALTAALGAFIPKTILDNEVKIYFPSDHPSYKKMENLDDTYGSQIFLVVSITNPRGTIIAPAAIEKIRDLTAEFEAMQGVVNVKSMTNIDYLAGSDGGMASEPLVPKDFAGTEDEIAALTARIADWRTIYDRVVVSEDRSSSEIIVTVDHELTAPAMTALYRSVRAAVDGCEGDGFDYRVAGDPALSQMAQDFMRSDLSRLIPAVSLILILCLYFSFRNLAGTLLPLITVLISTIWTVGLMPLTGAHFTVVSSCLPVLLIAVGSAYGIHVINHYYEDLAHDYGERPITRDEHLALIKASLKKVRKPVLLAGITTIVGFSSTFSSPIVPLKTFAVFSTVGVTIALALSMTLIPALLSVRPLPADGRLVKGASHRKADARESKNLGVRTAARLNDFLHRRTVTVAIIVAAVLGVSVWGVSRIKIESALLSYFPRESRLRRDVEFIDRHFAGSNLMSFVVVGTEKGDLADPRILEAMDEFKAYLSGRHPEIGKMVSYSDFIKRMNKVMHIPGTEVVLEDSSDGASAESFFSEEDFGSGAETAAPALVEERAAFPDLGETMTIERALTLFRSAYAAAGPRPTAENMLAELEKAMNFRGAAYDEIPVDPAKYAAPDVAGLKDLVSQYLILYSGSLDEYANDQLVPSAARISVQLRTHETGVVSDIIQDAKDYAEKRFPDGYVLEAGGIAEMEAALTSMITSSQLSSLLISIAGVFIILTISFRSPLAGILGSITLGLSILINFGIMGLLGINLDMVTSLISSIAVGIGIDYTIHFLTNYHHERLLSTDLTRVTFNTYMVSGKAILVNAVSVALGFLVLAFSEFVVLRYIGILVAICMVTSSLTAMTVLPVMLNVFKPKFISRADSK